MGCVRPAGDLDARSRLQSDVRKGKLLVASHAQELPPFKVHCRFGVVCDGYDFADFIHAVDGYP